MSNIKNIAFVGAGGRVGSTLASALIDSGRFQVTAITRVDSGNVLPPNLFGAIKVNYNDHAALVKALKGQDVLIITMNVRAQTDAQELLIDAAVEANVKYIVPNEWAFAGADSTVGEESGFGTRTAVIRKYIEKVAAGRDTHWISVTCGFWYEFSLVSSFVAPSSARFGFDHKSKTVTFFDNNGQTKIHTSTWGQLARGLVALLSLPLASLSRLNDSSIYIASFQVSQKDMFESLLRVTGESESDWTVKHEGTMERYERGKSLKSDKTSFLEGSVIQMYSRIFWPDGSGSFGEKLNNRDLGLSEENLDEATKGALELLANGSKKI